MHALHGFVNTMSECFRNVLTYPPNHWRLSKIWNPNIDRKKYCIFRRVSSFFLQLLFIIPIFVLTEIIYCTCHFFLCKVDVMFRQKKRLRGGRMTNLWYWLQANISCPYICNIFRNRTSGYGKKVFYNNSSPTTLVIRQFNKFFFFWRNRSFE